jgi:hypothetical protein
MKTLLLASSLSLLRSVMSLYDLVMTEIVVTGNKKRRIFTNGLMKVNKCCWTKYLIMEE